MSEREHQIGRLVCLCLAALLAAQVVRAFSRPNPVKSLELPAAVAAFVDPPKPKAAKTNAVDAASAPPQAGPAGGPGMMGMMPPSMPMGPGGPGGPGGNPGTLPDGVRGRIEKIRDSEILGPVPRPVPMGLIGIAGPDVFLRAPGGMTGVIRIGEQLGGVKLISIGANRVVVEHEGQKKELSIFAGFGSEPLLPPPGKEPSK